MRQRKLAAAAFGAHAALHTTWSRNSHKASQARSCVQLVPAVRAACLSKSARSPRTMATRATALIARPAHPAASLHAFVNAKKASLLLLCWTVRQQARGDAALNRSSVVPASCLPLRLQRELTVHCTYNHVNLSAVGNLQHPRALVARRARSSASCIGRAVLGATLAIAPTERLCQQTTNACNDHEIRGRG